MKVKIQYLFYEKKEDFLGHLNYFTHYLHFKDEILLIPILETQWPPFTKR